MVYNYEKILFFEGDLLERRGIDQYLPETVEQEAEEDISL